MLSLCKIIDMTAIIHKKRIFNGISYKNCVFKEGILFFYRNCSFNANNSLSKMVKVMNINEHQPIISHIKQLQALQIIHKFTVL